MALDIVVPALGESITEATVLEWRKSPGDSITKDEVLVELETDKVTLEIYAEASGVLLEVLAGNGTDVDVGTTIGRIDGREVADASPTPAVAQPPGTVANEDPAPRPPQPSSPVASGPGFPDPGTVRRSGPGGSITDDDLREFMAGTPLSPSVRPVVAERDADPASLGGSGPGGRIRKEDVPVTPPDPGTPSDSETPGGVRRVPMTRLRRRIAERLKEAQNTAAMLTTFNEVDMSRVVELRASLGEAFQARHDVRLGFMSFFVKASVEALRAFPAVNAEIEGTDILYKDYFNVGVAVGGGRGLVVPVLRNADRLSFADIERRIRDFGTRAADNRIEPDELDGGTFTISNGGVYGSMLSTPILNPPQSGILGLHQIQERPVVVEGAVVVRPMMYLALSYDHRIVDGREAVSFLVHLRGALEEPARLALDI